MNIYIIIVIVLGLFIFGMGYNINSSNTQWEENTWFQNGIVIEIKDHWYGTYALIIGDDGERYKEYCNLCLVGDKVNIQMQKDFTVRIIDE